MKDGLMQMPLSFGYLTTKQARIWSLNSKGSSEAAIAKELNVTRQTIYKSLSVANEKIYTSLEEAAKINKIKISSIDASKGVLSGYSPHFKTKILITFSAKKGVQVWYKHEGDCKNCEQLQSCLESLIAEAEERGIPLPENWDKLSPSQFADILFAKLTGEENEACR